MSSSPAAAASSRSLWKWGVCGLLLLATMINYMDRLTLNQTAKRIMSDLSFQEDGYGRLEGGFGVAFAIGALTFGLIVDKFNVRWVYPIMVALWSIAGMLSGFARTYEELLWSRVALGFCEAANWPCALRTTQRLLRPDQRTMGNSILQSGAAVGAVLTPWIVLASLAAYDSWRPPFWVVGAMGFFWSVLWLIVVRSEDLSLQTLATTDRKTDRDAWTAIKSILSDPRFWVLVIVVVAINVTWHFFRAWLPLYLQGVRGYTERQTIYFTSAYYVFTDAGALAAGFVTSTLIARGLGVHASRMTVYFVCALITLLSIPAALIGNGPLVLALFLVMGFAALGLFPNYYSFSQELTTRHQGKVTGTLGFACWVAMYFTQTGVGNWIKSNKARFLAEGLAQGMEKAAAELFALQQSYQPVVALAGIPPMIGFLALLMFWRTKDSSAKPEAQAVVRV